jgi:Flp pilus assembly CpaE family ATPase
VTHTRGFRALLAPRPGTASVPPGLYGASVALLAGSVEVIVLHVPRWSEELRGTASAMADEIVIVGTDDDFSLYGARTLLGSMDRRCCQLVLNRSRRRRVRGSEFEVVAGLAPAAVLRSDRAVASRQDRGELLGPRARRAGRDVRRLAAALVADRVSGERG